MQSVGDKITSPNHHHPNQQETNTANNDNGKGKNKSKAKARLQRDDNTALEKLENSLKNRQYQEGHQTHLKGSPTERTSSMEEEDAQRSLLIDLAQGENGGMRNTPIPRENNISPFSQIRNDFETFVSEMDDDYDNLASRLPQRTATITIMNKEDGPPPIGRRKTQASSLSVLSHDQHRSSSSSTPAQTGSVGVTGTTNGSGMGVNGTSGTNGANGINEIFPTRSLWLGNIDPTLNEADLRREFQVFGPIESLRLLPSKECAFVNFYTIQDAIRAKEQRQGTALGSLIVRIGYGKAEAAHSTSFSSAPLFPTNAFGMQAGNGSTTMDVNSCNLSRSVWVGHIGPEMDVETLCMAFSVFGQIESCRILDAKNCAFVNYYNAEHAAVARKAMNGVRIGNAIIKTGFAKSNTTSQTLPTVLNPHPNANGLGLGLLQPATSSSGDVPVSVTVSLTGQAASIKGAIGGVGPTVNVNATGGGGSLLLSLGASGITTELQGEETIPLSTQEVQPSEFKQPIVELPTGLSLPLDLSSGMLRECRRRVEHYSTMTNEIEALSSQLMPHMLAASVDPVGNILVQKLIERGSDSVRGAIMNQLNRYIATVGVHKNGTWVIQKLINNCRVTEQRLYLTERIRTHVVPLLQDQFGNYVVQCCLAYGPAINQFVWDALYHRCVEVAMSRFGSRAMKSCLESPHATRRQQKFVAMALLNHAVTLVHDANGVIVLQWLLDSDLPGRFAFLASVLRNHFSALCLSKHASSIVAKLVQPTADPSAQEAVIEELFLSTKPAPLPALLQEPMAAAILLKALTTARSDQRCKMAEALQPHLSKASFVRLAHLQRLSQEVSSILSSENNNNPSTATRKKSTATTTSETKISTRESLSRAFSLGPTLLSQAVGGPVSNPAIIRTCIPGEGAIAAGPLISSPASPLLDLRLSGRSLSFGSVQTVITDQQGEAANLNHPPKVLLAQPLGNQADRIAFGPSLLQNVNSSISERPPTPS